ncbi:MAG: bifunctional 3-deoxy-7-phosphoheptulonate synthase/chorismate mutase type II [Bacteroidales bacterium]|nr:bifunctional 3-deoxy-7-phosphoheptulonate synthase/chorismate mutase type II [Bacteroidales bacterium]
MEQLIETTPMNLPGAVRGLPILIAGPCSAETEEQTVSTARALADAGVKVFRAGIWKPRTRPGSFEGIGSEAFHWLKRVKEETGMLTAVEVANAHHVYEALKFGTDILWVGARTTANPFTVQEIADALRGVSIPVFVKNPVNPDIELWMGALERINRAGISKLGAIHRGFSSNTPSGYRNQPYWEIPLLLRKKIPSVPLINDPSHISGRSDIVCNVAMRAMSLGFDGLIVESHINPESALSDGKQQLLPSELREMKEKISKMSMKANPAEHADNLDELRSYIDMCDHELLTALLNRMSLSEKIGRYKRERKIDIVQNGRWNELLTSRLAEAKSLGLREEFIRSLFNSIHRESVHIQKH